MNTKKKIVGILGTSANPLHEGHVELGLQALTRLQLEEVLFMVTPHNPHKDPADYAPLEHRTHLAYLALMATGRLGNKFKVSDFEATLLRYGQENSTANMLQEFSSNYPLLQPVWLMGEDSFAQFHTWGRWQEILEKYPVGVLARSGTAEKTMAGVAAQVYKEQFVPEEAFAAEPGTWTFLSGLNHRASSTAIRDQLRKGRTSPWLCGDAEVYIQKYGLYGVNQSQ